MTLIEEAREAITGSRLPSAAIELTGPAGLLASAFDVLGVAEACVVAALEAGAPGRSITLDRSHVAAAVRSERSFRAGATARPATSFHALSGFWQAADGWVRTHANYPWHREALLRELGTDDVAAAIAERRALELEDAVFAADGICAALRTIDEWHAHPQGQSIAAQPLVSHVVLGEAAARRPAERLRVLDFTRVIAGPMCTRLLGALGADVLRLDAPALPDFALGATADTLLSKRSAAVDLATQGIELLLADTDVVVIGYRPGALDRFGLSATALAERFPGLVIVELCAWGNDGPWAQRRGFDSVVQGPTGIALTEGDPGVLPCQLLDHGTGYLAAAAALDGVRRQREQGGTHLRRLSLARTAHWLTGTTGSSDTAPPDDPERWLVALPNGAHAIAPPGTIDGTPLAWTTPSAGYQSDPLTWGQV